VGLGVGILGVVFIVIKLRGYGNQIDYSYLTFYRWLAILGLTLLYGAASCILLPLAWHNLLKHFGVSTSLLWSIRAYGISQLAKYVPGNVFHLASRQVIGVSAGLPGWPLAKSTLWDLILEAITGVFFGILVVPFFVQGFTIGYALVLFILAIAVFSLAAAHWLSRWVAYAIGAYFVFLTFSGIIFVVILSILAPLGSGGSLPIVSVCSAYVVAWLAGLVTPGAPAGAGVRELVLFALLNSLIAQKELLYAIVLGRVVTVVGDVIFYCFSMLMSKIWSDEQLRVAH
jgi:uncharacterized membrane protein YbhN (UPF0104 family)